LKGFGVSDGRKICWADVRCDGDISGEIEMNWKWQGFIEVKKVTVGDQGYVKNGCKLFGDWVVEMLDLNLENIRCLVDKWHQVLFFCHGQSVVQNFIMCAR
jgi:hypothetical protein